MIRLSKSCLGDEEKKAVMRVLDREFLGMGAEVKQFEDLLSEYFGRTAVCVNTGTSALHLALQAIELNSGDEVLVQSLTYVASYQAISAAGGIPVSCEVNPDTVTIDVQDAERRLSSATKAIMPVHYGSGTGPIQQIYEFADRHNLRVIEDAAHAFGSKTEFGELVGSFGDIACFSFDGIKNITSGEGGCVVTEDQKVIERIKNARLLGVNNDTNRRFSGERSWDFDVEYQGWRFHMSNIMAAIGIEQFKKFSELAEKRRNLAKLYVDLLKNIKCVQLFELDFERVVPHIFVVRVIDRDINSIRKKLLNLGIQSGKHYNLNHQLSFFGSRKEKLPITEHLFSELLTLPLHPDLTNEDVYFVCGKLKTLILDG
jgi:dTDP-4-amino-4,6-dideoxygalactose transaminase